MAKKTAAPKPPAARTSAEKLARLQKIIADIAIVHSSKEAPILTRTGGPSRWLADIRMAFMNPESLDLITDLFWERYEKMLPLQVAGMEVGAIPLVTAIITKATALGLQNFNGFIIRKERKDHGRTRTIEGEILNMPVVLVDDIINSGSSLEKCRVVLEREGAQPPKHVFVIIDFHGSRGMSWRKEHGIEVQSLYKLADFGLSLKDAETPPATTQSYRPSWRAAVKGANPFHVVPKSGPVLVNDLLYMGSEAGLFMAFDARTGVERWRFNTNVGNTNKGIFSTAAVHNGRLYFGAYNGNLYCLNALTGELIWMQQLCEWIGSSPLIVPQHNQLYIGLEYARPRAEGSLAAFNLESGARVWEVPTRTFQHGSAAYDEVNDTVVFGTNDNTVLALKAQNGEKVWEVQVRGAVKYAPAVNAPRGLVGATSFDGSIYLFNSANGGRVAEFPTSNVCYSTPLFHGNRMFATSSDKHLYVINLDTLEVEAKIDCYARLFATPVFIAPGTVAVGATNGRLIEVDLETLKISGRVTVPDSITNAIAATPDGKLIVVQTFMNELYAFHRSSFTRNTPPQP